MPAYPPTLSRAGVTERFVLESFRIGFSDGSLSEQVAGNAKLSERLEAVGLLKKAGETLRNRVILPILNEDRAPLNIVGVSLSVRSKHRDRERFIYNLIDRFAVRDHLQLDGELSQVVEVIEKHREQHTFSPRTIEAYTRHAKEFIAFLAEYYPTVVRLWLPMRGSGAVRGGSYGGFYLAACSRAS